MRLTVYVPTYGRWNLCLEQVQRLHEQRHHLPEGFEVTIAVSVNGDPRYSEGELREAGADAVQVRSVNLGGEANYCLAFEHLGHCDYLWVVSDDDPIQDEALSRICSAISQLGDPALIVLGGAEPTPVEISPRGIDDIEHLPIASISCSIFRSEVFTDLVPYAFSGIATHFPQVALIRAGIHSGRVERIALLPTDRVVDLSSFARDQTQLGRGGMGARTGGFFFGGGLLVYLEGDPRMRKSLARRWWRQHWHRLSMYRLADSAAQEVVDRMGRSSVSTVGWWFLSLAPWWRLKDRLDSVRRTTTRSSGT